MKVLITGAGLIGSTLAAHLVRQGLDVALLDVMPAPGPGDGGPPAGVPVYRADVRDRRAVESLLAAERPDVVVHTAALVGGNGQMAEHLIDVNVRGTATVAAAAARHGVRRLVFTSSLAVYGKTLPDGPDESTPPTPVSLYGASKAAAELVLANAQVAGEMEVVILRLAGVYGPARRGRSGWMAAALLEVVRRCLAGGPVNLGEKFAGGLEYLHVDDAVAAIGEACVRPWPLPLVMNVGAERVVRGPELAETLIRLFPGVAINAPPAAASQGVRRPLPCQRAFAALGYRPRVDLDTGLRTGLRRLAAAVAAQPDNGRGIPA